MSKNQKGFWRSLEKFADGAVMAEWVRELGHDVERARPFLVLANGLAETHPCINAFGCGYPHRVEQRQPGQWLAFCETDESCPPFTVLNKDLLVFTADTAKLCGSVARALGFETNASRQIGGVRALPIGTYGPTRANVYLMFPADGSRMAREVERLFGVQPDPFLLLTPTGLHCSAEVESALRRQLCMHIPMSAALILGDGGSLAPSRSAESLLKEFLRRQAEGRALVKTVERIDRNMEVVVKQKVDLSAAKARLQQMHGEGIFAFARHIDREAREQFLAVMACGDVAKAARDLSLKDSTLRSKLAKWPNRGKAYAALAEIIRWRKSIKGQAGMEFAKRVASGAERDVDFPALIRDVVAELEELDPENWEERCGSLADTLRKAVS